MVLGTPLLSTSDTDLVRDEQDLEGSQRQPMIIILPFTW
jgi:hypothetical protein